MINHGTGWVRMEFLVPARGPDRLPHRVPDRHPRHRHRPPRLRGVRAVVRRAAHPARPARWSPTAAGVATSYAMFNLQERGSLFVEPTHRGLRGHDRRREQPRRRHGRQHHQGEEADQRPRRRPPTSSSGWCRRGGCRSSSRLEFCREDECVEVTPDAIRLRKVVLDQRRCEAAPTRSRPTRLTGGSTGALQCLGQRVVRGVAVSHEPRLPDVRRGTAAASPTASRRRRPAAASRRCPADTSGKATVAAPSSSATASALE